MNIFELFAVLTLQKDDYNEGLDETERQSNSWGDKIKGIMQNKAVMAFALVGKAVVDVGKKLNQLMLDTMNYADTVGDLAAKYGVTTNAISEMQYIADQSSTSIEGMTSAMTMLLNRAKENGEGFKELGVDVYDANGNIKQMDDLFYDTIGALNNIESEGERSRLMLETFGRSAMNVGEVVRKSSEELAQMRQEAHDLGIVMEEDTINFASDMNDKMAVLKLQGQSALASLVAGDEEAEEKLQNFFDGVIELMETYVPTIVNFAVRLLIQIAIGLIRVAPTLASELIGVIIDTILETNWVQVGIDIGKSLAEGIVNTIISGINTVTRIFGFKIPKVDFGVGKDLGIPTIGEVLDGEYEVKNNVKQDINVNIEASGDTPVSEETAEKTAQALAPYIDKILGGM